MLVGVGCVERLLGGFGGRVLGSCERAGVDGWFGWSLVAAFGLGVFWERADAGECAGEVVLPGPAGGEVERPLASRAGQPAGDLEQPAAYGARDTDGLA